MYTLSYTQETNFSGKHVLPPLRIGAGKEDKMDEAEQKAIADLLRTVRIAIVVMAAVGGGLGLNEMMGVI